MPQREEFTVAGRKSLLAWEIGDGVDSSVRFMITENRVSRVAGKVWHFAKKVGKGLWSIVMLAGLISQRNRLWICIT